MTSLKKLGYNVDLFDSSTSVRHQVIHRKKYIQCHCDHTILFTSVHEFEKNHKSHLCLIKLFCTICGEFHQVEEYPIHKCRNVIRPLVRTNWILFFDDGGHLKPIEVDPTITIQEFERKFGDVVSVRGDVKCDSMQSISELFLNRDVFRRGESSLLYKITRFIRQIGF